MSTENQWLSVQDIAELLQIKDETVRRWIRRHELPVLELGGPRSGYRVRREDLDHFIWQRYRMRHQASGDRTARGEFKDSQATTGTVAAVQLTSGDDGNDGVSQAPSISHTPSAPTAEGNSARPYDSRTQRIPGITYVTTVNRQTGESTRRHILFVSGEFEVLLDETSDALRNSDRHWWERVHPDDRERVAAACRHSHTTGARLSIEYRLVNHLAATVWVRDEAIPGDDTGDQESVWHGIVLDITDRKRVEDTLQARIRQHAAVAELGEYALRESDPQRLMDAAVTFVQQSLNVEYVKILELLPRGEEFLLRAGTGWKARLVGNTRVRAEAHSQAGYTLLSNEPVIVTDLRTDTRFNGPQLLCEHGVRSGISAIIAGHGKPWGVIGAHTGSIRDFSVDDLAFLQSAANILATAIRAVETQQTVRRWLSIKDVADILRVTEETVRRWIRRGELPVIDLGSFRAGYRIHPTDLDQFIQERYMQP